MDVPFRYLFYVWLVGVSFCLWFFFLHCNKVNAWDAREVGSEYNDLLLGYKPFWLLFVHYKFCLRIWWELLVMRSQLCPGSVCGIFFHLLNNISSSFSYRFFLFCIIFISGEINWMFVTVIINCNLSYIFGRSNHNK